MRSSRSIRYRREFERLVGRGRMARRDGITVYVDEMPDPSGETRLGMAVRLRGAVRRNRARRRLRAAFREVGPRAGYEVLIRARDDAVECDWKELRDALGGALRDAGVFSPDGGAA